MNKLLKKQGFTLVELLITMAIVSILAAIAIPSFGNYVAQARRSEAEQELMRIASRMENCYSLNNNYTDCLQNYTLPAEIAKHYTLNLTDDTKNTYTLIVTAKDSQKRDKKNCQQLAINHLGRKFSLNDESALTTDLHKCW